MEKKIVFVVREGLAVRNMNGQFNSYRSTSSVMVLLEGLKDTLTQIPSNAKGLAQDFVTIYLPDVMNGLLSSSIGLYLRNGKTASGKLIDEAELNLYVEVFNMLNERSFNVRLYNLKYVSKEDVATKNVIKNTWSALDREERKIIQQARAGIGVANSAINNSQMEAMQQQMAMMQQMMTMFGSMMQGSMMQGDMMQMPNIQGMPTMQSQPSQPTADVQSQQYGDPTALNVNLNATSEIQSTTETTTVADDASNGIQPYEPEF